MAWKTAPVHEVRYSVTLHPTLPIMTVIIKGIPTATDAEGMGRAMRNFSMEVNRPWAMLSDVREMPIANADKRRIWVQNMREAVDTGLTLWAIVVADHNIAALQSKNVAEDAVMDRLTLVTTDFKAATDYTNAILTAKPTMAAPVSHPSTAAR